MQGAEKRSKESYSVKRIPQGREGLLDRPMTPPGSCDSRCEGTEATGEPELSRPVVAQWTSSRRGLSWRSSTVQIGSMPILLVGPAGFGEAVSPWVFYRREWVMAAPERPRNYSDRSLPLICERIRHVSESSYSLFGPVAQLVRAPDS